MQCIRPLQAGQNIEGRIIFRSKENIPGLVPFEFECRKCLPCRLNIAREKAIRCVHEAQTHEDNIFLTLTYNDESLSSPWLQYEDFQLFMKRLRWSYPERKITYMVTGEYGDKEKRPHWHAIVFNFKPEDEKYHYTSDRGDKVFTSQKVTELWQKGHIEYGSVTMDSAGYVARYAAKKLTHGKDHEHKYHPIHKTSSKRAIGRSWIEKHYKHTFENGFIVLDGVRMKIPRYYLDWAKKHKPEMYRHYVTEVQKNIIDLSIQKKRKEELQFLNQLLNYSGGAAYPYSRKQVKEKCLEAKFKQLQERLKL